MAIEIKSVTKGDREYKNIDLRDLDWDESMEAELRFDKALIVSSQYGTSYSYGLFFNGEEVTAFIPESFKSPEYGVSLHQMFSKFKRGDKLKVSKHEGKMKDGRSFRYFNVIKLGEGDSTPNPKTNSNGVTETIDLNLEVEVPIEYSNKENQLIDGLKASHPEYTEEIRVKVFVQNGIPEERAKEIVKNKF